MANMPGKRSVHNAVSKSVKPVAATTLAAQRIEEGGGEDEGGGSNFLLFNAMPSVLTSMIVHTMGLLVLALLVVAVAPPEVVSEFRMASESNEDVVKVEDEPEVVPPELNVETSSFQPTDLAPVKADAPEADSISTDDLHPEAVPVLEFNPLGAIPVSPGDLILTVGEHTGDFEDRLRRRRELVFT